MLVKNLVEDFKKIYIIKYNVFNLQFTIISDHILSKYAILYELLLGWIGSCNP